MEHGLDTLEFLGIEETRIDLIATQLFSYLPHEPLIIPRDSTQP
jgi:hypothetical protein